MKIPLPQTQVPNDTRIENKINGVSGRDTALQGYTGPETTWAYEVNCIINHAPGAGSIVQPATMVQPRQTWAHNDIRQSKELERQ